MEVKGESTKQRWSGAVTGLSRGDTGKVQRQTPNPQGERGELQSQWSTYEVRVSQC